MFECFRRILSGPEPVKKADAPGCRHCYYDPEVVLACRSCPQGPYRKGVCK